MKLLFPKASILCPVFRILCLYNRNGMNRDNPVKCIMRHMEFLYLKNLHVRFSQNLESNANYELCNYLYPVTNPTHNLLILPLNSG